MTATAPRVRVTPGGTVRLIGTLAATNYSFWYGAKQALFDISLEAKPNAVTALIGPSGCGKSTFLRSINRLQELLPRTRHQGDIAFDNESVFGSSVDPVDLRRRTFVLGRVRRREEVEGAERVMAGRQARGGAGTVRRPSFALAKGLGQAALVAQALTEVLDGVEPAAQFEQHDAASAAREFARHRRAPRARPDDAHFSLHAEPSDDEPPRRQERQEE